MEISLRPRIQEYDAFVRRTTELDINGSKYSLYSDIFGDQNVPDQPIDGLVYAFVFKAMEIGRPLRILDPIGADSLLNLREYIDAFATLWPQRYHRIEVQAAGGIRQDLPERRDASMLAFSGGVDSMFALLHRSGSEMFPLRYAVFNDFVGGRSDAAIERFIARYGGFLSSRGIKLLTTRSNLRSVLKQDTSHSFSARYAACLHNFSHLVGMGYLNSAQNYREMVIGFGSTPATDHLLSTSQMRIFHEGAGFCRTEKVKLIAQDEDARRLAMVCGRLKEENANCGVCTKCAQTRLNFLAVGLERPECMPGPFEMSMIDSAPIPDEAARLEFTSIVRYCERNDIREPWVDRLRLRLGNPASMKTKKSVRSRLKKAIHRWRAV